MNAILIPPGRVANNSWAALNNPEFGDRTQSFSYQLLDNEGAHLGALDGVKGGTVEWHQSAAVKGGGKLTVVQRHRFQHNWLKRRIKIIMHIEGMDDTPLGVFIPSAPVENWDDMNLTLDLDLYDKSTVLDNDYVLSTHTVPEGANVIDEVRSLITSTGEGAGSITDAKATLDKAMVWDAGTSKLTIINDLLAAANYNSLHVDGNGKFQVDKYRLPKDRPSVHFFSDGFESIYAPEFGYAKDEFAVPNKVVMIGQGDGDTEALRAVATNENPDSPYSYQSRGRWIVDVTTGVEAVDQAALDDKAQRRLHDLTTPPGTLTIDHAPLPWLSLGDKVRFKRIEADIDIHATVQSMQISLDPTDLQRTELQEVADL